MGFFLIEAKNKSMIQNVQFSSNEMEKLIELLIVIKSISKSAFESLGKENYIIMEKIFNEIWPHLKILFNKFSTNNDLVEEIIQLIKFYMRGLKDNFKLYIPEYLNCLIEGYKLSPISSYLYGYEILITVFGNNEEENIKNMINVMFNQLCQVTFNSYIRNRNDLLINVQLGEDFFGLMYRILKISPIFLIDSEMLDNIILISLENLSIDQIQISKNIIIFINNLINCPYKNFLNEMKQKNQDKYLIYYNKIQKKIEGFISSLIKEILQVFLLVPPNVIYENISHLVMNLVKRQQNLCIKYFSEHLKDFPSDVLTNKEKDNFIVLIQNISIQEKKFEDYLEFIYKRCQNKQIRDNGKTKLGEKFTEIITYDIHQWHKYDLLVSQKGKINALSILTKKINTKYVTIYFTSMKKLEYTHKGFVLINKSINEDNPFNNKYSMTEYEFECYDLIGAICAYEKVASGDKIDIPYLDILIRYYSILSYYAISQAIPTSFKLPFE